jgi:Baseplate J-like protein
VVTNPPGLSQISYRVDDFTGFRRALLRSLLDTDDLVEQSIMGWRPVAGDLGLQVLEWWAYLADVLTFYNERIANESYLRTGQRPESLANLAALLGYQPAPAIAATGYVAALGRPGNAAEPLVIPAGMQLSSVATPDVASQIFEVNAQATFTGPSSVPVTLLSDETLQLTNGAPSGVLLAGRVSGIKVGDRLVLAAENFAAPGDNNDNWSMVTVTALTPATDPNTGAVNTSVAFSSDGWGPASTPMPSASTSYRLLRPTAAAALFNGTAMNAPSDEQAVVQTSPTSDPTSLTVHLAAAVRAISPGDLALFDAGDLASSALAVVTATSEAFYTVPYPPPVPAGLSGLNPPDIVIAHTTLAVTVADQLVTTLQDMNDAGTVGSVAVRYGFKDVGTIIGVPAAALASLPATVGVADADTLPTGGTAMLQDANGIGMLVTVSAANSGQVTLAGAGTPTSTIPATAPLVAPLELLLDLVAVSRGTTVTGEVLGSGNAALASQSFTLAKSPLTYLASGNSAASTLKVYVDQVEWSETTSFYGQAPNARVFVVSRSPDQTITTVTFGDGLNGARLTSGAGNVIANYRYGAGAASPPAGRLTTINQPQPGLASIQNPVAVSGGADAQSPESVRANAPASVSTFGRAISADDYQMVAAQAPGVSRTAASWTFDATAQRTVVTVYVGDDPAAVAAASAALAGAEDPNRPISVVAANPITLGLSCTLVVAADRQLAPVVAEATTAISDPTVGLFSPTSMGIGQWLYRSAVAEALMVAGVVAVHNLTITRMDNSLVLDEVFDPGEGSFFELDPDNVAIGGGNASA